MIDQAHELRRSHPRFIYHRFEILNKGESLKFRFHFELEPRLHFTPEISVSNLDKNYFGRLDSRLMNNLVFHLGLIEIPSYWKAAISPKIIIKAGNLSQNQIDWWQRFFLEGMGQFYYTNKIDFRDPNFLKIEVDSHQANIVSQQSLNQQKILVPLGGGKDSLITLEILKKTDYSLVPFILEAEHNPTVSALDCLKIAQVAQPLIFYRKIDPRLFYLNKTGYLNGHTPIAAYISFASLLAAGLSDASMVAISNERSADEPNISYLGRPVNHQYDKSWKFEQDFSAYLKKYLTPSIRYFSFLRPLYELQIAKIFSKYPSYFQVFRSCNVGQKTNSWCGKCPKCLSTYADLYPFLPKQTMISIFGKNLFEDKSLLPLVDQLVNPETEKPFECVGTKKENRAAFWLSLKKARKEWPKLPILLDYFQELWGKEKSDFENETKEILNSWSENNLPDELQKILKSKVKNV